MRRMTVFLAIVLLVLSAGLCLAQMDSMDESQADMPDMMGQGMMDGGMGGGMMGGMHRPMMGGRNPFQMWQMMVQELGLTNSQQQRLMNVFMDFAKVHIRQQSQVQVAWIDLVQMLMQDKVDRTKAEAKVREINRLQQEDHLAALRAVLDAKSVLTLDQWHKFRAMIPSMLAGGMGGPGMMRPGGMPPMGGRGAMGPGGPPPMGAPAPPK